MYLAGIIVRENVTIYFNLIFQISQKRTAKYEKDYIALKQKELESQDPIERLEVYTRVASIRTFKFVDDF